MTGTPRTAAHEAGVAAHLVDLDLRLADDLAVEGPDGHHLQRVRRLRVGEHLTASDGRGRWRRYEVTAAHAGRINAVAVAEIRTEGAPRRMVTIAPALSKGSKLETIVSGLTEIGVATIRPLLTEHSVVRPDAAATAKLEQRLAAAVRAAATQCRRSFLPTVAPLGAIDGLAGADPLLVAALDGRSDTLTRLAPPACTVVTGPEGGLSPAEREHLRALGARDWSLGAHVLRAETAPLAAAILALA